MDVLLDFEECLQDSPVFRLAVDQFESDVAVLELQINKVLKCCSTMVEAGQVYSTANQLFVSSLAEFSGLHKKEDAIAKFLSQFNQGLHEMVNFHTMLLDQTQNAINQQLTSLLNQFVPPLGEIRREFVRIGDDLETAALKNAQVSCHKESDAECASDLLIATRKCYQHFALDYCLQLNSFKIQQKVDILNSVFSYFHAQYTFFHQGFDLLRDLEPTMKTMEKQLAQLSAESTVKRKDLENYHRLVQRRIGEDLFTDMDLSLHVNLQGDEQNDFEPNESPPQAEHWIPLDHNEQLNSASDEEAEDFEDDFVPEQTEDNGGDTVCSGSSRTSEHKALDELISGSDRSTPDSMDTKEAMKTESMDTKETMTTDSMDTKETMTTDSVDTKETPTIDSMETKETMTMVTMDTKETITMVTMETKETMTMDTKETITVVTMDIKKTMTPHTMDTKKNNKPRDSGEGGNVNQTHEFGASDEMSDLDSTSDLENCSVEDDSSATDTEDSNKLTPPEFKQESESYPIDKNGPSTKFTQAEVIVEECRRRKDGSRKGNKMHYCLFCHKPNCKISRHLVTQHAAEVDVARALSFTEGSKRRLNLLEKLRYKGDYQHNLKVMKEGKGQIVTMRQPPEGTSATDYLPCSYCLAFFIKKELLRHQSICKLREAEEEKTVKKKEENTSLKNRVQTAASPLVPVPQSSSPAAFMDCECIIDNMKPDAVTFQVRNDELICQFGDSLYAKSFQDISQHGFISLKLRELGRLVLMVKRLDRRVRSLSDLCKPSRFQLLVNGIKKGPKPSLASRVRDSLRSAAEILVGQSLMNRDEKTEIETKDFIDLLDSSWNMNDTSRAHDPLEQNIWNKEDGIPLMEDVLKLHQYLKNVEEDAKDKLRESPCPRVWKLLNEIVLAQVDIFCTRPEDQAAHLKLESYQNRNRAPLNEDVFNSLTKLEQELSKKLTTIQIKGKGAKEVLILFTDRMKSSVDTLIDFRDTVGVPKENPFVFAQLEDNSHIQASDCLRKFAEECEAKNPEHLTSTKLQKHVATLCQLLNLKDHELEEVAKLLGHNLEVHCRQYKLVGNSLQMEKVSQLLFAIENGAEAFKGKSLEENEQSPSKDDSDGDDDDVASFPPKRSRTSSTGGSKSSTSDLNVGEEAARSHSQITQDPGTHASTNSGNHSVPKPRTGWSEEERTAIRKHFSDFIADMRVPCMRDCVSFMNAEPLLQSRSWRDIKSCVNNTITTSKRRRARERRDLLPPPMSPRPHLSVPSQPLL